MSSHSEAIKTLMEMGFSQENVEIAVSRIGSTNVTDLMDWLLSHEEELVSAQSSTLPPQPSESQAAATDPDIDNSSTKPELSNSAEKVDTSNSEVPEQLVPKSFQCDECGKLFKTNTEVEYHATKSGHGSFSESTEEKKPLTEEEKKEQLARIEAKLKQRRLEREAREKEEEIEREKNRIRSSKELLEAKKKHEELEMKKIVEQRKREKEEERLAKERVRKQIEQDKLARKQKFSGSPTQQCQSNVVAQPATAVSFKPPTSNYSEVRLQIRLMDGQTLTETFGAKEPLSAVRLYIEMNRKDGDGPFKLMTTFPKQIFTQEDYDKPLDTLGLAPTATIVVSKC